jgi:hypothetical protein
MLENHPFYLQWIEIHNNTCNGLKSTAGISAVPMGLSDLESQRLGSCHTDRFQSSRYQKQRSCKRARGSADLFKTILPAMDNLQWIEIHSSNISRPDGTF